MEPRLKDGPDQLVVY